MKRTLSIVLAFVMVALMIPFSAFVTSANGATASPYDVEATTSIYDVDFSKVKSDADLTAAGWSFLAKSGTSPIAPQYLEGGVRYVASDAAQLVLGAVEFNNTDTYVVDYTFKFADRVWIFENSFVFQNATEYNGGYDRAAYKFRASEVAADACWTDGTQIFADKELTTYANSSKYQPDPEYSKKACEDFADCRIRLIVEAGVTQYAIYTIDGRDFFLKKEDAISVANGSLFGFCHVGGDGEGGRGVLLKNFAVYTTATADVARYSVDFSKIKSAEELQTAGWNFVVKDGVTNAKAPQYLDDGVRYIGRAEAQLVFGAMTFSNTKSYVIDYTFKFAEKVWIFENAFNATSANEYFTNYDKNAYKFRSNESNNACHMDGSKIYADAAHTTLSNPAKAERPAPEIAKLAYEDFVDCRVQIFVENGTTRYLTYTIGDNELYVVRNDVLNVADGTYFAFAHVGGDSEGARGVLLKNFTVYETGVTKADYAYATRGGVTVTAPANTTVALADMEAIAVNTPAGLVANASVTMFSGAEYSFITKSDVAAMKLTAAGADLRLASNPGIRFKSGFDADDFALVSALVNSGAVVKVDMGTLVTVKAYRDQVDAFTAEKLEALEGNTYMNIVADGTALYTANSFAGSVISVKDLTRDYIAVGYVTVTFADGTSVTVYTAEQTASVVGFADAIVEVETPDFGGYTEAEVEALKYIASLNDVAA